ncbi:MAG: CinA family protein [Alphaproteobacteria bacterium]|nr:CinA family protein [Alphaproteobacteria bacterium]
MQDLVKKLSDLLKAKNIKLVTAESCTGGLLAASITHRAGASAVFDRGYVTYTNASKHEELGVAEVLLDTFGAVSAEVAEAMAKGALKNSHAGLAVSITGIAGPDGGSAKKPVGLVYFGYALKGGSSGSMEERFAGGSRETIQARASKTALLHLIKVLEEGKV